MSGNYRALETRLVEVSTAALPDEQVAVVLNNANIPKNVDSIDTQSLFDAIRPADRDALSELHRNLLYALLGMGQLRMEPGNTRDTLAAMFAGTPTADVLVSLRTRLVSWANENWSGRLKPGHVRLARCRIIRRELVLGVVDDKLLTPTVKARRDRYLAMDNADVAADLNNSGQAVTLALGVVIEQHVKRARV